MPTKITQSETQKVPKLRFPEFSGVWEEKKLGEVTKINQGLQIPIAERFLEKVEDSYFYITNEFLKENSQKEYYIKNPPKSVLCEEDDILMTRTGNTGHVVTNVAGAFHNNFFKIKYNKKEIEKNFLYAFLTLPKTKNLILRLAGTSTIPDLNHNDFYKIKINLPFLPEQEKIAGFLGAVDEWIVNLRTQKNSLESYKKGMMQKIFPVKGEKIPEIRFKDTNGKNFPDWEEKKLGEVLKIGSGKDYKHLGSGDIPVFGTGGYMLSVDKSLHSGETVFIGRKGTIDKPFYYNGDFWTVDTLFYTYGFREVTPKFVNIIFQQIRWKKYNEASGVPSLSKETIKEIKVDVPSLPEQQKIAGFLTSLDNSIESKQQQIIKAEQWEKGLMQGLFV